MTTRSGRNYKVVSETIGEEWIADLIKVLIEDRKSRDAQFEGERKRQLQAAELEKAQMREQMEMLRKLVEDSRRSPKGIAQPSINADQITSLDVISSPSAGQECPPRYIRVNQDLNQGSGGNYIYLCYSTDPFFVQPVTDILVVASTSSAIDPPAEYTLISEDLNKGAGGKYIYLMYTKRNGRSALEGIDAIAGDRADTADVYAPPGWIKYTQDLNEGSGGKYIYFIYKYEN
ncbi:hypothetical protein EMCRGX_G004890 [Ephydatia muelleri]